MGEHLKRLKELRLNKGISQKEIADYLGITVASYSLYERGNREPGVSILKKMAEYYGVTLDYLMDWADYEGTSLNNTSLKPSVAVNTIAAHFDGDEYTKEELEEIHQFAEFVKSKRNSTPASLANATYANEPGELEKMRKDLESLKRPDLLPNAAHERTDIDFTEEKRQADEDMLD